MDEAQQRSEEVSRIKKLIEQKKREIEAQQRDLDERRRTEERIRRLIAEKERELTDVKLKEDAARDRTKNGQ